MENCKTAEEIQLTHTISGITPVGHFKDKENYGAGEVAREAEARATELIEASQLSNAAAAGEAVYGSACNVCHGTGLAGAPALGDRDNWTTRLGSRGPDTLVSNAVNGYTGDAGIMPPKGGHMQLTDDEVSNAVRFMLESSGIETEAGQ
jgi:cytochrome c